jgi:hypothetical protein
MRHFREMIGNRREFFRAGARYALLAALSGAACLNIRKSKLANQKCIKNGICDRCIQFADCGLPAALSRKQIKGTRA